MELLARAKEHRTKIIGGLIVLVVLIASYFWLRDPNPHFEPGAISGEGIKKNATYKAGEFSVEVSGDEDNKQLIIRNLADPQHTVLATVPGRSLAGSGHARTAVHESRGSFKVEEEMNQVCTDQIVDSISERKDPDALLIRGSFVCPDDSRIAYQIRLIPASPARLLIEVQAFEKSNRTFLFPASSADEGFFGFGEQFTYFNMKGRRLPIIVQEQGIGRWR